MRWHAASRSRPKDRKAAGTGVVGGNVTCAGVGMRFSRGADETSLEVLRDVSFDVPGEQFVSLLGPSGCGKSTLLRIIDGLAPATEGSVRVSGKQVMGPGPDRGFVFQADSLLPWRTVAQNVGFGLKLRGQRDGAKEEVSRLLALTGLVDFGDRYPHELSGGMRQRANLARALAVDPLVLLMDEPFAALDAQTRELMQAEVLRLWSETRKTVIFVTHSIEEAVYMSDRILLLSSRPATICADFPITLPRPRTSELRRTPEFAEIAREIWERLRDDVVRAFEEQGSSTSASA